VTDHRSRPPMNPYLAGGLAGLLAVASVLATGKYLGASTTFVRVAGRFLSGPAPDLVAENPYFAKYGTSPDWQWMFVLGILLGALGSALATRTFRPQVVPDTWRERFGPSAGPRLVAAFVGGFVMIFGARLAGGCPSGHGLSGVMQLSVSSLVAAAAFFAGGMVVARLLYGGGTRGGGR